MKLSTIVPASVLPVLAFSAAFATTIFVRPDGSGDYATIQQAVDAAHTGDVLQLTSGTFTGTGNRDIVVGGKGITIRGGDPTNCAIDCQSGGRAFQFLSGSNGTLLEGITISNGTNPYGGAIEAEGPLDSPVVRNCIFYRNHASTGGVFAGGAHHTVWEGCRFIENSADGSGGAVYAYAMSGGQLAMSFNTCVFSGNTAGFSGGAVHLEAIAVGAKTREAAFQECTFSGNDGGQQGGALFLGGMSPLIERCTFYGNSSASGGAIDSRFYGYDSSDPVLVNSVIAFSAGGAAIVCGSSCQPVLSCCDLFGNPGGDWTGCIADQAGQSGNISEDPRFCAPAQEDFTLDRQSPCAPPNNPECGQIGAWPVGCDGPVPVVKLSWGRIKRLYE